MAQVTYSLVWKFYKKSEGIGMHQIYDGVINGGEFTAITLWRYI
jgi:hypothetical protein